MAAPTLVDPTKQAEYPIVLGDRLLNAGTNRLVNINYNYKAKHATSQQCSTVTPSQSRGVYDLTVTDKAPSADHTVTYTYKGTEDPDHERDSYVLVWNPDDKVFVLEPVSAKWNFNLRSAPGKTEKQVREQYEQLRLTHEDETTSGDDRNAGNTSDDEGAADDSNPYDFRHFFAKPGAQIAKPASGNSTPEPIHTSKANTPVMPASKPAPKPMARPKKQANPFRETKKTPPNQEETRSTLSDAETGSGSQQTVQSPNSNLIIDGDLIIDMGSPKARPAFNINPAFFSSNNTPKDEEEDEEEEDYMEDFRLPSPARTQQAQEPAPAPAPAPTDEGEEFEEDPLAAEMEAAFEEAAFEESQQYSHNTSNHYVQSDDESEVSEEE
ncbi:hypothetical protein N7468_004454 [Penicillium chermesinum]|uniref:Transcription elongation factor Eaf N-terminal domain-containing protein n=1 Tax=Penicillium chermesinum TaxID=63820 RepID=A0A9W9P8T3_9EURO|nr:uncharacterized protein N7468_004454 [Penicillium chermesinum]KAJ5239835.1 hypothetical protein N7468_004454 [Penicillium chermesinum]